MDKLERVYKESWYTIIGCGGDLGEWKDGHNKLLSTRGIGTPKEWIDFTGEEVNEKYETEFPNNLRFLAFSLDGLKVGKLAIFRMEAQDMWFDDMIDNYKAD